MNKEGSGTVYLVGAGPGDPGLITVRGIERLRQADVVIHDRLINYSLLAYAPQAEFIDVGKQPDRHPVKQSQINQMLVENALAGKTVVRLKGGDPFVFGRGGEEALALTEAGIAFEVVPGISSAIAAPAYAGIPITHRSIACSAAIITGHRADCTPEPDSDWMRTARGADTLVFLMGVQNLPRIVEQMLAAGKPPETPVALIEQATCRAQKTVTGTLADIVSRSEQICPPAVIVIGEVVKLREYLRWFDLPHGRPLTGICVVNTRPTRPAAGLSQPLVIPTDEFSRLLSEKGAWVVDIPTTTVLQHPELSALGNAIRRLPGRENGQPGQPWVLFGGENEVRFALECLFSQGADCRLFAGTRLAALSLPAARALREFGLLPDLLTPSPEALAAQLSNSGARSALLLHNGCSPSQLQTCLPNQGIQVEAVQVCCIEPALADAAAGKVMTEGTAEFVTFFSASAVAGMANILGDSRAAGVLASSTVVCIGASTIEAANSLGIKVDLATDEMTPPAALVELLVRWRAR